MLMQKVVLKLHVGGTYVSFDGPPQTETLASVMILKEGIHQSMFL